MAWLQRWLSGKTLAAMSAVALQNDETQKL